MSRHRRAKRTPLALQRYGVPRRRDFRTASRATARWDCSGRSLHVAEQLVNEGACSSPKLIDMSNLRRRRDGKRIRAKVLEKRLLRIASCALCVEPSLGLLAVLHDGTSNRRCSSRLVELSSATGAQSPVRQGDTIVMHTSGQPGRSKRCGEMAALTSASAGGRVRTLRRLHLSSIEAARVQLGARNRGFRVPKVFVEQGDPLQARMRRAATMEKGLTPPAVSLPFWLLQSRGCSAHA